MSVARIIMLALLLLLSMLCDGTVLNAQECAEIILSVRIYISINNDYVKLAILNLYQIFCDGCVDACYYFPLYPVHPTHTFFAVFGCFRIRRVLYLL